MSYDLDLTLSGNNGYEVSKVAGNPITPTVQSFTLTQATPAVPVLKTSAVKSASISFTVTNAAEDPVDTIVHFVPVTVEEVIQVDEAAGCTGYDKDEKALMVPMKGNNKIKVKIVGVPPELLQEITFIAGTAGKLTITPEVPAADEQELTLAGTDAALGVEVKLKLNGAEIVIFEADILKKLTKTLEIHAITEENDDVQKVDNGINAEIDEVCVEPGANGLRDTEPQGDDVAVGEVILPGPNGVCNTTANNQNLVPVNVTTAASLEMYLNKSTWGNQANVYFSVTRKDQTANYDLDRNGKLADEFEFSGTRAEDDVITNKALNQAVDYNIYYVNSHEFPIGITLRQQVFTQGSAPGKNSVNNHTAHEVGHLLGKVDHEPDDDALMYNAGLPGNPCKIFREEWRIVNQ